MCLVCVVVCLAGIALFVVSFSICGIIIVRLRTSDEADAERPLDSGRTSNPSRRSYSCATQEHCVCWL